MIIIFVFLAILIGTLMPIQAGFNAELTRNLEHPFLGAFISLLTGAIIVGILSVFHGDVGNLKKLPDLSPHLLLGGVFGAIFVGSSLYFIPRMGATAMIGSFITGQMLCSVMIDHYGLMGMNTHPVSMTRIAGVFLLFAGLFLVVRKGT
jgi:transporter family-2 protein